MGAAGGNTKKRLKITSLRQSGVRGGNSLDEVLENDLHNLSNDDGVPFFSELKIVRIRFKRPKAAQDMVRVIRSQSCWKRIDFERSSGKCIGIVVQAAIEHAETLDIMQHFDYITWDFSLDFSKAVRLQCIQLRNCKFNHKETLVSLSDALAGPPSDNNSSTNNIRKLDISCLFLHPETFPTLIGALEKNRSLQRLWMPKCSLSDDQIVTLVNAVTKPDHSLTELGLSYNKCGVEGSAAIASLIALNRIEVLYLNKQQNEMDLFAIVESLNHNTSLKQLNLEGNYNKTDDLLDAIVPDRRDCVDWGTLDNQSKWVSLDANSRLCNPSIVRDNPKFPVTFISKLSEEDVVVLNTACERIKQVLLRSRKKDNSQAEETEVASCYSDLLTIIRIGDKEEQILWIRKFLRKLVKGDISKLRPLLLPEQKRPTNDDGGGGGSEDDDEEESCGWETVRLQEIWKALQDSALVSRHKEKSIRKTQKKSALPREIVTAQNSPLVKEAYDALPDSLPAGIFVEEEKGGITSSNDNPFLALSKQPVFVDTVESLRDIEARLASCRLVGLDSEWYNANAGNNNDDTSKQLAISTLQIAFFDDEEAGDDSSSDGSVAMRACVVDLLSVQPGFRSAVKDFIPWLFNVSTSSNDNNNKRQRLFLGFAFSGDMAKLEDFAGCTLPSERCLDVQKLLALPSSYNNGSLPGLKKCAERYLPGKHLDKELQCSDWTQRPLGSAQLHYAGLDAAILLVLLFEKRREEENNGEHEKKHNNATTVATTSSNSNHHLATTMNDLAITQ